MKTTLILLLASVTCLVNARPLEHDSGLHGPTLAPRAVGLQAGPGNTGTAKDTTTPGDPNGGSASDASVQPPPGIIPSLVGNTGSSPTAPPPSGGDFIIQYKDNTDPVHFKYGQCVAFKNDMGVPVNYAEFREAVGCFIYQDGKCTKQQHPLFVPLPGRVIISNILDVGTTLAGSYTCYKSTDALLGQNNLMGNGNSLDPKNPGPKGLSNPLSNKLV